jgi:glycosyltransferase involved in cell wall biosynthesis
MGDTPAPRVSVVIPTYNMERHIARTLGCVTNQTFASLEVLVVDDCSTYTTPSIVKALAEQDRRIRYIRLEKNSNLPAVPRNVGILQSRGEYVAFLDHDDTWTRGKLACQVALLDKYPEVDMAHAPLWVHVYGNRYRGLTRLPNPAYMKTTLKTLLKRNTVMCSSAIVRKSSLDRIGGFDEDPGLRTVEDYELWLRIASKGIIKFQPFICGSYFYEPSGALSQENVGDRIAWLRISTGLLIDDPRPSSRPAMFAQLLTAPITCLACAAYTLARLPSGDRAQTFNRNS